MCPISNDRADHINLLEHSVHQFGSIARSHEKLLRTRSQQAAFNLQGWPAVVLLRVDDIHAGGGHCDVIDVAPCAWDPSIVENSKSVRREFVEFRAKLLLADRTDIPGCGRLRIVAEGQQEAAELWMI